jgi:DNA-binding PadR family transcriptional regulator
MIVNELGIEYRYGKYILRELELEGFVKTIGHDHESRKVYVYNRNYIKVIKHMKVNFKTMSNKEKETRRKRTKPKTATLEYIEWKYQKQMQRVAGKLMS